MSTDEIDSLIERYLHLLDQYTSLRSQLNTLQASIYQNIARANFSAERGLRYGQDHYDDRMQATQRVKITPGPPSAFSIAAAATSFQAPTQPPGKAISTPEGPDSHPSSKDSSPKQTRTDPLLMFGILTPPTLRQAQSSAIEAVEEIIPRLASVDAEMREVEIGIRRARKRLARKEKGPVEIPIVKDRELEGVVT